MGRNKVIYSDAEDERLDGKGSVGWEQVCPSGSGCPSARINHPGPLTLQEAPRKPPRELARRLPPAALEAQPKPFPSHPLATV